MTKTQKIATAPLLAAIMLVGGGIAGYTGLVSAQSTTPDTTAVSTQTQTAASAETPAAEASETHNGQFDQTKGGHVGKNGVKEELLTGDNLAKARAAALAANLGGTIQRIETDAEGAVYEAHMTKADGSRVTVKFDSNFNITATESGPMGR